MPNQIMHPSLSQLLPLDKIPNEVEAIRDALASIFDSIFVKNLIASQSYDNSSGFYSLTLTTYNSIGIDIPIAQDLRLVLNPTNTGNTEIPIAFDYATQKGLRKYINDKIGNTNINNSNTEVIYRFLKGVMLNNEYLNGKQPSLKEELDNGVNKILDFFSYVTSMGNLQVTLEAKAGVSFGGHLRVGEGLTAAIALEALAEINYQGILFQNGALTDLDINDPLRAIYQEIRKALGLPSSAKKIGAKTIFSLEKN